MSRLKLEAVFERNPSARKFARDLQSALAEIVEILKPRLLLIAGSMARGEFVKGMSDVDVFAILNYEPGDRRFLLRAVADTDLEVTAFTVDEALAAIERGNQFVIDAIERGLLIFGDGSCLKNLKSAVKTRAPRTAR